MPIISEITNSSQLIIPDSLMEALRRCGTAPTSSPKPEFANYVSRPPFLGYGEQTVAEAILLIDEMSIRFLNNEKARVDAIWSSWGLKKSGKEPNRTTRTGKGTASTVDGESTVLRRSQRLKAVESVRALADDVRRSDIGIRTTSRVRSSSRRKIVESESSDDEVEHVLESESIEVNSSPVPPAIVVIPETNIPSASRMQRPSPVSDTVRREVIGSCPPPLPCDLSANRSPGRSSPSFPSRFGGGYGTSSVAAANRAAGGLIRRPLDAPVPANSGTVPTGRPGYPAVTPTKPTPRYMQPTGTPRAPANLSTSLSVTNAPSAFTPRKNPNMGKSPMPARLNNTSDSDAVSTRSHVSTNLLANSGNVSLVGVRVRPSDGFWTLVDIGKNHPLYRIVNSSLVITQNPDRYVPKGSSTPGRQQGRTPVKNPGTPRQPVLDDEQHRRNAELKALLDEGKCSYIPIERIAEFVVEVRRKIARDFDSDEDDLADPENSDLMHGTTLKLNNGEDRQAFQGVRRFVL